MSMCEPHSSIAPSVARHAARVALALAHDEPGLHLLEAAPPLTLPLIDADAIRPFSSIRPAGRYLHGRVASLHVAGGLVAFGGANGYLSVQVVPLADRSRHASSPKHERELSPVPCPRPQPIEPHGRRSSESMPDEEGFDDAVPPPTSISSQTMQLRDADSRHDVVQVNPRLSHSLPACPPPAAPQMQSLPPGPPRFPLPLSGCPPSPLPQVLVLPLLPHDTSIVIALCAGLVSAHPAGSIRACTYFGGTGTLSFCAAEPAFESGSVLVGSVNVLVAVARQHAIEFFRLSLSEHGSLRIDASKIGEVSFESPVCALTWSPSAFSFCAATRAGHLYACTLSVSASTASASGAGSDSRTPGLPARPVRRLLATRVGRTGLQRATGRSSERPTGDLDSLARVPGVADSLLHRYAPRSLLGGRGSERQSSPRVESDGDPAPSGSPTSGAQWTVGKLVLERRGSPQLLHFLRLDAYQWASRRATDALLGAPGTRSPRANGGNGNGVGGRGGGGGDGDEDAPASEASTLVCLSGGELAWCFGGRKSTESQSQGQAYGQGKGQGTVHGLLGTLARKTAGVQSSLGADSGAAQSGSSSVNLN
ncbi:hypothetical protein T492DRAFT_833342 [Pavlovales sp. CCMP2436]|nr:hypothetical protein T492DRAFT_833342 [Pavlovales sp. CCMP2436]